MAGCLCASPDCRRFGCRNERASGAASNIGRIVPSPVFAPNPIFLDGKEIRPAGTPSPADQRPSGTPPKGWECPRCAAILAPHIDRCTCRPEVAR